MTYQVGDGNVTDEIDVGVRTQAVRIADATGTVGFYGKLPVSRRAYTASVHATTAIATSTAFGASQLAVVQEIMNTLTGLGVWASA